jgi:hypothetical protein
MTKPHILQRPQAANKETHPGKLAMAAQSRQDGWNLIHGEFVKSAIFEHENHQNSIEKNDEGKEKI